MFIIFSAIIVRSRRYEMKVTSRRSIGLEAVTDSNMYLVLIFRLFRAN